MATPFPVKRNEATLSHHLLLLGFKLPEHAAQLCLRIKTAHVLLESVRAPEEQQFVTRWAD